MSLSIQRSIVEKFNFNGINVRSIYIKNVGECLSASDVYKAVGYNKENGVKAIKSLVPKKYKLRFGDINFSHKKVEEIFHPHPDTVLLKEPGLYSFLLRCKRSEAEPFLEWVVEEILPREVQKLKASTSH